MGKGVCVRACMNEREGAGGRESERERQTDRQTARQTTNRQTDR